MANPGTPAWHARALQTLYGVIQHQAWLKRIAVRLVMWFPGWGERVMARVGTPAGASELPVATGRVDTAARERYRHAGWRGVLDASAPWSESPARHCLYVDISGLVQRDARTGIQRVVRNLTRGLVSAVPPHWRVEPVYIHAGQFHHARRFVEVNWQMPHLGLPDDPIVARSGDVFFCADLALLAIARMREPLAELQRRGVPCHFVLYDLIPVTHPEFYQGEVDPRFARWLEIVLRQADSLLCISAAVATQLHQYLQHSPPRRSDHGPAVHWFHLGAELPARLQVAGSASAQRSLTLADAGPDTCRLLMVGTLEPRKGHAQVLAACEALWADGVDVALVIIGKVGWNVRELVQSLQRHPQAGRRLLWLDNASDAVLCEAYRRADALVAASYTEGFGLPLIEAAQHGLPVIARDLPVFREVAGEHAWYFRAATPGALAEALQRWLQAYRDGQAPGSSGMPYLTWEQSATQVARAIIPADVISSDDSRA